MRFEGRELKSYAEPVNAVALREGEVYFSVNFIDDAMLIPQMQPVVFIGRNLEVGDSASVYFQDADSYRSGVRYSSAGLESDAVFESGSETELNHIFEFDQALDVLLACSLRRSKAA